MQQTEWALVFTGLSHANIFHVANVRQSVDPGGFWSNRRNMHIFPQLYNNDDIQRELYFSILL